MKDSDLNSNLYDVNFICPSLFPISGPILGQLAFGIFTISKTGQSIWICFPKILEIKSGMNLFVVPSNLSSLF